MCVVYVDLQRFALKLQLKDLPRNFLRILKPGGFMPPPAAFSKSAGHREFLLVKGQLFMWEIKWRRLVQCKKSESQILHKKIPPIKSQVIPQKSTKKKGKNTNLLLSNSDSDLHKLQLELNGSNCQLVTREVWEEVWHRSQLVLFAVAKIAS